MNFFIYFNSFISFLLKNLVALTLFFRFFSFDHNYFIFFLWFVVIFHIFLFFWSLYCEVILCCFIFFLFTNTLLIFTNFREQILTKCSCPLLFQGSEVAKSWSVLHCFMGIKVFRNSVIQYISASSIFLDLKVVTLTEFVLIATLPLSWMIKINLSFYSYFMAFFIELGMLDILIVFILFLREFFNLWIREVVIKVKIKVAQISIISKATLNIFIFLPFRLSANNLANHFLP